MYGLSAKRSGQCIVVAIVERWLLVEVRLYQWLHTQPHFKMEVWGNSEIKSPIKMAIRGQADRGGQTHTVGLPYSSVQETTNKMGGYNIRGIIFYCTIYTSNDTIIVKSDVLFLYFFISVTIYHILIQIMMQVKTTPT